MSDEMGIFETMRTLRAIRRYKPDAIPDQVVAQILEAGTLAPSGGNGQPWQFIILRDANVKRQVGEIADSIARERRGSYPSQPASKLGPPTPLGEAPLLIMVCRRTLDPPIATSMPSLYASIYPAVQNMLLAARAQGVGGVLVTMFKIKEQEFKDLLGIPEDVEPSALPPFGYPKGNFGPVTRMPWRDVTFADHWGTAP
jgi:nitroreductase